MINELIMENFKVFVDTRLELGALNLLTGLNSSGKSSVIQALRLLYEKKPLEGMGPLKGFIRYTSREARLACKMEERAQSPMASFTIFRDGKYDLNNTSVFSPHDIVSYISADRYGPKTTLPMALNNEVPTVGHYGEHIVGFLQAFDSVLYDDPIKTPKSLAISGNPNLKINIREWIRKISPGVDFEYLTDEYADYSRVDWNNFRPTHVGFGLSYALPIISSALIYAAQVTSGDIPYALLLIENPEAHLHPAGQTMMGQLLALTANCGVQIVVETHSDHLLNGVRIAIKDNLLANDKINCYYFRIPDEEKPSVERSPVYVEKINFDKHGMLDNWPKGFFDENEKNLLRLI